MFEKEFELRYFEMNKHGEATPVTMLTLLEETASEHCSAINHGLFDLMKKDIGWVLVSGVMHINRYPKHKEKIKIKTWLSSYSLVKGVRENIIYDENENIIGAAKGLWVFFDVVKRRPVQIFDDIKEKWDFIEKESIAHNIIKKISPLEEANIFMDFSINRFDIDMNQHVSNLKYLHWLLETIPDDIMDNYSLNLIDGRFINEATLNDRVLSFTHPETEKGHFKHTIKVKGSNIVCATAHTFWKERK